MDHRIRADGRASRRLEHLALLALAAAAVAVVLLAAGARQHPVPTLDGATTGGIRWERAVALIDPSAHGTAPLR